MECGICYFDFFEDADFFTLHCCKNNRVCKNCINLFVSPVCPFCRANIPIEKQPILSKSYPAPSNPNPNVEFFIDPLDDLYIDSRILRRQMNRMRKLQERERDRLYNKNLAKMFKESKKSMRNALQNHIHEDIRDFQIFPIDDLI